MLTFMYYIITVFYCLKYDLFVFIFILCMVSPMDDLERVNVIIQRPFLVIIYLIGET